MKICPKCYNYHKDEFDICRICGNDLTEYTEEYYNKKPKKIKTPKEKKKLKFPLPYFMQFWEKSTYIKVGVGISAFVVAISLTIFLWDYESKVKTDGNFVIAESKPRETVTYNLNSSLPEYREYNNTVITTTEVITTEVQEVNYTDKPYDGMTFAALKRQKWGYKMLYTKCRDFDRLRPNKRYYEARWYDENFECIGYGLICFNSEDEDEATLVGFIDYTE